jgi:hypothetical protein
MSTLRDDVLPIVDLGRQIIDDLGFRQFSFEIVTRTWSSGKIGSGTPTDTSRTIAPNPKAVEQENGKKLLVGPLTPAYTAGVGGGYTPTDLRAGDAAGVQVRWKITGPFSSGKTSVWAVVSNLDTGKPLRYMLTLSILDRDSPF